jgi:hypothetical protein
MLSFDRFNVFDWFGMEEIMTSSDLKTPVDMH